jgi:hypothetical protein
MNDGRNCACELPTIFTERESEVARRRTVSRLDNAPPGSPSSIMPGRPRHFVHLYALCWNEERLLPFFFRHYDPFVTRYFIFDHDSTDRSRQILKSHPHVTLGKFEVRGDSYVSSACDFYDHAWKESRGGADWVVICNIDEHLEHPDFAGLFDRARKNGATIFGSDGFEMITAGFPKETAPLRQQTRRGWRSEVLDKASIFNPNAIREIDYMTGRHDCTPQGCVVWAGERVRLLHYKYLGLDYLQQRMAELGARRLAGDIRENLAHHYDTTTAQLAEIYRLKIATASSID